ncbi:MAG TPA: ATP-grasp domain-containing protein, partial [Pseudomonadota bacterium]|nr:ATP-grasp domain-containing protein [Pseudomonadota bacterium]
DALDPGIYTRDLVSDVFLLPYPSQGLEPLLARIEYIHSRTPLHVIVPTLDSELPAFIEAGPQLRRMGIATFLPSREQLELRSKAQLAALGLRSGISVPATAVITTLAELAQVHHRVPYPFFVKGVFYGATLAKDPQAAEAAFHKFAAEWGLPIIVQTAVPGDEVNVVALGDGQGGLVGAVAMKKLLITDKGKGWAGVTIRDEALLRLSQSFMAATGWRGGCELELIRDRGGGYHLIEINPRFPAWVYLSAAAGINLPAHLVELAGGGRVPPQLQYEIGKLFVRISYDQIATLDDFQQMLIHGELSRQLSSLPATVLPRRRARNTSAPRVRPAPLTSLSEGVSP